MLATGTNSAYPSVNMPLILCFDSKWYGTASTPITTSMAFLDYYSLCKSCLNKVHANKIIDGSVRNESNAEVQRFSRAATRVLLSR